MTTGMLYALNTDKQKTFEEKIDDAIKYFINKYNYFPTLIYVSPFDVGKKYFYGKIEVEPSKYVGKSMVWIINKDMSNEIESMKTASTEIDNARNNNHEG
jgi:hypothetical protein